MSFLSILVLAVGLSMDAAAVSAARGLGTPRIRARHFLLVALFFGGFQALMPLLGWLIGHEIGPWVCDYDHWIAFVLLGALGGKMLWEARSSGHEADDRASTKDPYALGVMTLLAVATSVDAFAVGITLPMLGAPLLTSLLTIGLTTAALSAAGLYAGKHLGALLGKRLDMVGGLVLVGLGTKILIEHLQRGI